VNFVLLLLTALQAKNSKIAVATNPIVVQFGLPGALLNFKFHLIAHIHDTTQVLVLSNLWVHDLFGTNILKTRLNWYKIVAKECDDAPWQIVTRLDTAFCVFY
jgi:hypothetical protein